jgi:hypothetical protein
MPSRAKDWKTYLMTDIPRKHGGKTAIICGTGPSINPEIIDAVNNSGCVVFGANRAYEIFDCDVVHGCDARFWHHHWKNVKGLYFDKWTTRPELKNVYPGLEYIEEKWRNGLSKDQNWISANHGTGPQLVNIAYLYGCTRLLLVGWDMHYHGKNHVNTVPEGCCEPNSPISDKLTWYSRRHFLDEDEISVQHWPRTGDAGEFTGLIKRMETIVPEDYGIEIINCTPGSAMVCFPFGDLNHEISR